MGIRPSFRRATCVAIVLQAMAAGCGSSKGALMDSDAGSTELPSDAAGTALSCAVEEPAECPDAAPHFADVLPIFEQRCGSCHTGGDGPLWPLNVYEDIADWHDIVRNDLVNCKMPPEDGGVTMTHDERLTILVWIRCALPR